MAGVDLDRGVCQRRHPEGMLVGYYKDAPGAYFDENGNGVSEQVAAAAGHDVQKARVQRVKQEKLAEAKRQIEAEVAELERRVDEEVDREALGKGPDLSGAPESGYGLVHAGGIYYQVIDTKGNVVSGPKAIRRADAENLMRELIEKAGQPAAEE